MEKRLTRVSADAPWPEKPESFSGAAVVTSGRFVGSVSLSHSRGGGGPFSEKRGLQREGGDRGQKEAEGGERPGSGWLVTGSARQYPGKRAKSARASGERKKGEKKRGEGRKEARRRMTEE